MLWMWRLQSSSSQSRTPCVAGESAKGQPQRDYNGVPVLRSGRADGYSPLANDQELECNDGELLPNIARADKRLVEKRVDDGAAPVKRTSSFGC